MVSGRFGPGIFRSRSNISRSRGKTAPTRDQLHLRGIKLHLRGIKLHLRGINCTYWRLAYSTWVSLIIAAANKLSLTYDSGQTNNTTKTVHIKLKREESSHFNFMWTVSVVLLVWPPSYVKYNLLAAAMIGHNCTYVWFLLYVPFPAIQKLISYDRLGLFL